MKRIKFRRTNYLILKKKKSYLNDIKVNIAKDIFYGFNKATTRYCRS